MWSATSYSELAREAMVVERLQRLDPLTAHAPSHLATCLPGDTPVVAASDYVRAWPLLIAPHLDARMTVLGTDGFGRSDTREQLRRFFEVDRHHIVLAALQALLRQGKVAAQVLADAAQRSGLAAASTPPWEA